MTYMDYIKKERLPTTWCPGCGLGLILRETAKVFDILKPKNLVAVSGIGCTGRSAGYLNLDSVHGLHGRAIPLAEGMKHANKKLNIVIISGDGDLIGIGGNHLLSASRRNPDITVLCASNEIYGMTGGQMSPTTKMGAKTLTSPQGNIYHPMNVQGLLMANENYFYARTTVFHVEHMNKCIEEAMKHKGFSFVEIIENCIANNGRRLGFKNGYDMMLSYKQYKIINNAEELKDDELGIVSK